jgi:hypothetical protein
LAAVNHSATGIADLGGRATCSLQLCRFILAAEQSSGQAAAVLLSPIPPTY